MRGLIAFDLDGVLYSAEPFLSEAYREAIANVNVRRPGSFSRLPSTREILDHVGWPVSVILERLFPRVDPVAVDLLSSETLDVIAAHVARREGILFPGVAATLSRLRDSGFVLAIASNGRRGYVATVLDTYGLSAVFTDLVTVDDAAGWQKADILRIHLAAQHCTARQLVMVGDRASDVEAAAAVGCRFIGCDYGHGYRHEIAPAGPLVTSFAQLPEVIVALFNADRNG